MFESIDLNYVKSWGGLLKVGEFFCLLVAFSSLAHFSSESTNNDGFRFFLFVTITSWLIVMILYGLFVTKTYERISINWTLAMIIYSAIEVFLLLVASSVVAEKARRLRRSAYGFHGVYWDTCDWYGEHHVSCSNVEAAVVFGFFALALFLADVVFYFIKYRAPSTGEGGFVQGGFVSDQPTTTTDTNPKTVEQIP